MGENHFSTWPVALYGAVLLMAAIACSILELALISLHGKDSRLAKAVGHDFKGKISSVIYASAIPLSFVRVCLQSVCAGSFDVGDPRPPHRKRLN
jgi:uncharacterized membrane protein